MLALFIEEDADDEELISAIESFMTMAEDTMLWGEFPQDITQQRDQQRDKGMLAILRGLLQCVDQKRTPELRFTAIAALEDLITRQSQSKLSMVSAKLAVEVGLLPIMCRAASEARSRPVLQVLSLVANKAPVQMLPTVVNEGAVEACKEIILDSGSEALLLLAALDLLGVLARRSPRLLVRADVYNTVKMVDAAILFSRRNKIMNLLRPLMNHRDGEPLLTTIRRAGSKSRGIRKKSKQPKYPKIT